MEGERRKEKESQAGAIRPGGAVRLPPCFLLILPAFLRQFRYSVLADISVR